MGDVTRILQRVAAGEQIASDELLPLVYERLRQLAVSKLQQEHPGHTLQPTALVHEAYLRLVDVPQAPWWDGRSHFFAAAAEAMRRILVEQARRKRSLKHGGGRTRQPLDELSIAMPEDEEYVLAVHEALGKLERTDRQAAELVKLRFFAGLSGREAAEILQVSPRTADRIWVYARAFLFNELA
ncbi:MAG: sigma-70 family RNA polymerase sigma factor [Pirellulaceae bacterium]|nr:sigma-70 family RNA polymerase sigma factor [Pirellulaceae bacterium]